MKYIEDIFDHRELQPDNFQYCSFCGRHLWNNGDISSMDHLLSRSNGGNNKEANKKPCCRFCRNWRGPKDLHHWKSEIELLITEGKIRIGHTPQHLKYILINIIHWDEYQTLNSEALLQPGAIIRENLNEKFTKYQAGSKKSKRSEVIRYKCPLCPEWHYSPEGYDIRDITVMKILCNNENE